MKRQTIFVVLLILFCPAILIAILQLLGGCGAGNSAVEPSPPNPGPSIIRISIIPSSITESEIINSYSNFKLQTSVEATDPQGDSITYLYQWYVNNTVLTGETTSILTSEVMTRRGHTCRGYEYKCEVVAANTKGYSSSPTTISVTVEGSTKLSCSIKGALFHNKDRAKSQLDTAKQSLSILKEKIGCNWVALGIIYFQSSKEATEIYSKTSESTPNTISESDLIGQIEYAQSLGLKIMLYPEIWIDYPSGALPGERNEIAGTEKWFSSYQEKILQLANIAEANNVEILCVGTELRGTQDKQNQWRNIISAVKNCYSGKTTYACIYQDILNDLNPVAWWDALDYIGVSCGFETRDKTNSDPSVDYLKATYEAFVSGLKNKAYDIYLKPIMVTELNIPSCNGASIGPEYRNDNISDFQEQADFFTAALETLNSKAWIAGIFVIDWFPGEENRHQTDLLNWPYDTGFDTKPAEKVIKSWFSDS